MAKNTILKTLVVAIAVSLCFSAKAQDFHDVTTPVLGDYFSPSYDTPVRPDAKGFITRWSLLEPITKPEIRTNAIFTDTYLKNEFSQIHFEGQNTVIPVDGQKVRLDKKTTLKWHCLDSKLYNVKLYRFAKGLGLRPTEALFYAVTVINVKEDMTVRLSVGSNSASQWNLNGEDVLLLSGDRRMVVDDCVSKKITLKAGKNILRGVVINGPGMSDFCVRFLDEKGNPVKDFTVSNN
ncbi:MAG: acetylxylan esterase [Bacteroidales bacterium]|nr:acetylxylan esterase [Bacteroidales bacterium]